MKVQSTGQSRNGEVIYLNSHASFRDPSNFTVMLILNDLKKELPELSQESFKDATVRVSGLIEHNENGPRIVVREASKVKVVQE